MDASLNCEGYQTRGIKAKNIPSIFVKDADVRTFFFGRNADVCKD